MFECGRVWGKSTPNTAGLEDERENGYVRIGLVLAYSKSSIAPDLKFCKNNLIIRETFVIRKKGLNAIRQTLNSVVTPGSQKKTRTKVATGTKSTAGSITLAAGKALRRQRQHSLPMSTVTLMRFLSRRNLSH